METLTSDREQSLSERIVARALELGFAKVAILPCERVEHDRPYQEWLAEGRQGEMGYLDKYHELRVDPAVLEPGMKTVIALLTNYHHDDDLFEGGLRIARYAHGDDYHEVIRERMEQLAAFVHAETGAEVGSRPAVDTAPLLERDVAAMAGLGWIGKNAMLISPEIGSYTFISELLVDLELDATHTRVPDRCGTCSRCIDACPTGAIISPYIVDARRCISYLTIELRGPIPRSLRPLVGDYLFGCDRCQDVCPWNGRAEPTQDPAFAQREAYRSLSPEELLSFDHDRYVEIFRGSAMKRAKHRGLLRNAAVVLGNRRDPATVPLLASRLVEEPEPLVRGHIAWALGRIGDAAAREALLRARDTEAEAYVLEEIRDALEPLVGPPSYEE